MMLWHRLGESRGVPEGRPGAKDFAELGLVRSVAAIAIRMVAADQLRIALANPVKIAVLAKAKHVQSAPLVA